MKYTYLSEDQASRAENCLGPIRSFRGFILTADAGNEMPGLRPVAINSSTTAPVPQNQPVVPFSGQGNRLGGDPPAQNRGYQKFNIDDEEEI